MHNASYLKNRYAFLDALSVRPSIRLLHANEYHIEASVFLNFGCPSDCSVLDKILYARSHGMTLSGNIKRDWRKTRNGVKTMILELSAAVSRKQ